MTKIGDRIRALGTDVAKGDGPNPSDEVLAAAKAASEKIMKDRRIGRLSILEEHKDDPYVHNSVVTGEVAVIAPGMADPSAATIQSPDSTAAETTDQGAGQGVDPLGDDAYFRG